MVRVVAVGLFALVLTAGCGGAKHGPRLTATPASSTADQQPLRALDPGSGTPPPGSLPPSSGSAPSIESGIPASSAAMGTPTPSSPEATQPTPGQSAPSIYLGVWQPGAPQDMHAVDEFEQAAGKHVAIVAWYDSWQGTPQGPDLALLAAVAAHGSVPMISWASDDFRDGTNQPDYNLAAILSGRYDGYINLWAQQLAAYGKPVLLRWDWEMNGSWYPWGVGVNGNTPAQFIAAWRHLHDLFAQTGATNVQWVWSPNVVLGNDFPLESLFPGDAYVDWLALDGFNHAAWGWRSFSTLFWPAYQRVTQMSSRPVMIAETSSSEADGSSPKGVSKAQWITSALTKEIPAAFPRVRALIWFNDDKVGVEENGYDWRITSSSEAAQAFARAIALPVYRSTWYPPSR